MKQIFTSVLALLSATIAVAQTTNLWQGSEVLPDDWSNYVQLDASKFVNARVADQLVISISDVSATSSYPQVQLDDSSWQRLPGAGNASLTEETTSVTYYITADMLLPLQAGGMLVRGCGYTLASIDLVAGNGGAGYENSVWIGNMVFSNWEGQPVPASSFVNAEVGDLLRMKISDLQAGAQGHISTGSWGDMPDATDFVQLSGNYYQFAITDAMLAELKRNGMIVGGIGYTLTSVDIIDPATIVPLTLHVPVTGDDWVWSKDETPSVQVDITNPTDDETVANATIVVRTDKMEPVLEDSKSVAVAANGSQTVTFDLALDAPGFYQCTISVNDELARSFNIGYAPTEIVSAPDAQSDFDAFWDNVLAELADVEPEYTLTELPEHSSPERKVYLVEMKSVADGTGNDITVRGYYAEPVAEGKYPALIHYQGYDSDGSTEPWCMNGGDNPGWVELTFSTRGQWINNRPPYENAYDYWFTYGFGNKDDYYYRGAYADAVRAIDFIASRSKTDARNIFAEGSSQGGALTIAAAALDGRLAAIAPAIQFMGDFPDYFKVGNWPASYAFDKQKELGLSDEQMYAFLSYFDTKNLAGNITCPVISTIGLQDNVCPPHTNIAPYNNLAQVADADKQISYNPELMHSVPDTWWNTYMEFFDKYMDKTPVVGIDEVTAGGETLPGCLYTVDGCVLRMSQLPQRASIVVANLQGAMVSAIEATGEAVIELPGVGVYVVSVSAGGGTHSFKVVAR